jgi:UDP-N-acetylmuramoyl-tripeptide--D-alanyl-D-alanine ligase
MRQNIISHKGIKIINDAYNASPNSMQAALSVLEELAYNTRSIAVLGDMLEMGEMSQQLHYSVGKFAADKKVEYIITVGPYSRDICQAIKDAGNKASRLISFDTTDEAVDYLLGVVKTGDYILVKGSRGMKMEKIVEGLINKLL